MVKPLVPIEDIPNLDEEQFLKMLMEGHLNSLEVPAKEYFERQDIIRLETIKRSILNELKTEQSYVYKYVAALDKTDEYYIPSNAILVGEEEGSEFKVILVNSEEELDRIVEHFKSTGNLNYYSASHKDTIDKPVNAIAPIKIQKLYVSEEFHREFKKH